MAAKIIDGKKMADALLDNAALKIAALSFKPCVAIVLVGDDPASLMYTKKKHDACARVGMESRNVKLPADATQREIIAQVQHLNEDPRVDAILVQLPLPAGVDEDAVLAAVAREKDVDGFHPENFGKLALGIGKIAPCTPKGVIYMLKESGVQLAGKHAVVIGRSRIVGKPLALLLLNEGCTVSVCHSKTKDMGAITRMADIICSAVGKPRLVTADMVKAGAVVIDIGTSKEAEKLVGDVDFAAVSKKASLITPVPGGVGPMTIAMLIENTLVCCENRRKK
ncbi:MAG: bifunctional 5,10-methylenetetrahydrofolate dehydrogenase/5,10-methenyltetrahydrofolate cyclohydrolase [Candidatus Micrarchaeota archaeon]|nr:bifunctional 5,10-methylenetetrahydrofolate dehydrogenase/5,10-methenyltetrahydrofolate cyclohydrolase [Candidatus Micrarchaeota archaeon]